jgi:putative glutamine amidotransferase
LELSHNLSYEQEDWTHLAHDMTIAQGSRLRSLLGVERMPINSLHHQSVREIAPGLKAVAWAPDGVIEALEGLGEQFIVGVQCHPEALQASADPRWQAVFSAFVQSCVQQRPAALAA